MEALFAWLAHPSTWIAVLIIGGAGEVAKQLILGPKKAWPKDGFRGWKGVYVVTYKFHAIIVGGLIGLVPGLPVLESLQTEGIAGSVMQYAGDGALSMVCYATVVGTARAIIENFGKRVGGGGGGPEDPASHGE